MPLHTTDTHYISSNDYITGMYFLVCLSYLQTKFHKPRSITLKVQYRILHACCFKGTQKKNLFLKLLLPYNIFNPLLDPILCQFTPITRVTSVSNMHFNISPSIHIFQNPSHGFFLYNVPTKISCLTM